MLFGNAVRFVATCSVSYSQKLNYFLFADWNSCFSVFIFAGLSMVERMSNNKIRCAV